MIHAITRTPAPALAQACELTFLARQPIDFARALQQHAAYCDALRQAGAQVTILPALDDLPDSVFVEDSAVVLDELVVLTRPGVASRLAEVDAIASALAAHRTRVVQIAAPGTLDGGDVLRVGKRLFAGWSSRSNDAGIAQLRTHVEPLGYTVQAVDVHGSLHLKTACTALDDNTLLLNPNWLDSRAMTGFTHIHVDATEPFGGNVLPIGDALIINAAFTRTQALIEQHGQGRRVIAVDISEFGKAEAGLTCMSLVFESN
jgi:dimethylargininase